MPAKKSAGRNALVPAEKVGPEFIGKTLPETAIDEANLRQETEQLVAVFGDGLPWQLDHYEAAIRNEMHRGCEAFLRAGRYLTVARGCANHGEWGGMLERLGIAPRQAHRMIEAARRISLIPNRSRATDLIEAAGSQSKLIEMLSLPEDQFIELAEEGESGDLKLDKIKGMTRDELRALVHDQGETLKAKDDVLAKTQQRLDKAETDKAKAQRRWREALPAEQSEILRKAVHDAASAVRTAIAPESDEVGLRGAVVALAEHADKNGLNVADFLGGVLADLVGDLRMLRDDESVCATVIRDQKVAVWSAEG
ncbi:hypothetical protein [Lysobacter sp. CA199]|uniref:hypothetical protein n=1 Tax=Lysobacter sp. CA199 TaxID=3455608 RepID=UPI003F8D2775